MLFWRALQGINDCQLKALTINAWAEEIYFSDMPSLSQDKLACKIDDARYPNNIGHFSYNHMMNLDLVFLYAIKIFEIF